MSLLVDIYKDFGSFKLRSAFENEGGILGLLGPSGSGKSLTLQCIAGIVKPDRGKIILDGIPLFDSEQKINLLPQQRRIGYLFQTYALFPHKTVRGNILCGLHREKDHKKREEKLQEIIALLQLQGLEEHRPAQLSGGQRQRTALARILVGEPRLLMLDEPFSALDGYLREQLQVQMKALLQHFGKSVLMVTHDRDEAYRLCDKIALFDEGTILVKEEIHTLFADPGSRQAALLTGCKNVVPAKKAGRCEVSIPSWGVHFTTARPVQDNLCAIGIRAHSFSPEVLQNSFPICVTGKIEEPFEYIVQFRFVRQETGEADIWWRFPKAKKAPESPSQLGVAPEDILLLYK